jgi:hypothetical protein
MAYEGAVRTVAGWHLEGEQPPAKLLAFPDPDEREIRLLEVTELVPETGEFYPVAFGPTVEIPYRTVVAQVTPREFDAIRAGTLPLPEGWDLDQAVELNPAEVQG